MLAVKSTYRQTYALIPYDIEKRKKVEGPSTPSPVANVIIGIRTVVEHKNGIMAAHTKQRAAQAEGILRRGDPTGSFEIRFRLAIGKGSQFNADYTGTLFTEEDKRVFAEKAEAISRQITAIEPLDGLDGNGPRKIGEVVADLTGMSLTLDLARKDADFDYDAFFRAFAWFFLCYMIDPVVNMPRDIATNPHPLPYIRINFTVQHFDEFYRTYPSVTEGTPMYMAPEDRLLVW